MHYSLGLRLSRMRQSKMMLREVCFEPMRGMIAIGKNVVVDAEPELIKQGVWMAVRVFAADRR
jgi:hypothetical protein